MWWIIIGAVIALVVMIVLLAMFTGRSRQLDRSLLDCANKGGDCITKTDCKTAKGEVSVVFLCTNPENIAEDKKEVCCFKRG